VIHSVKGPYAWTAGELLQLVRSGTADSRSRMASYSGMSPSTIASRIQSLLELGYLSEDAQQSDRGRKPRTLSLNPEFGVVATIDIGSRHTRLGFVDVTGELLDVSDHVSARRDVADYLGWLTERLRFAHANLDGRGGRLRGVGVSIASPVDRESGRLMHPLYLPGWDQVDLAGELSRSLGVPVLAENDAALMALGEHRMHYPRVRDMLYVKLGSAIGCGIVIDGELYGGRAGGAGEVGHLPVDAPEYRRRCECGRDTCLEAGFGGAALRDHLRARGVAVDDGSDIGALARGNDPVVLQVLRDAGTHIGDAIGTLCNLFNPELVVIGGGLSQLEPLTQALRAALYGRTLPLAGRDLQLGISRNGPDAAILGAAWQMIDLLLSVEQVNVTVQAYADTLESTSSSTR
jgi:predicted NBD/HSP70 family sugar kinase